MSKSQRTKGAAGERPIVVCRADRKEWLSILPIEELFRLIREEVAATGGK